jgi:hypothetical protein
VARVLAATVALGFAAGGSFPGGGSWYSIGAGVGCWCVAGMWLLVKVVELLLVLAMAWWSSEGPHWWTRVSALSGERQPACCTRTEIHSELSTQKGTTSHQHKHTEKYMEESRKRGMSLLGAMLVSRVERDASTWSADAAPTSYQGAVSRYPFSQTCVAFRAARYHRLHLRFEHEARRSWPLNGTKRRCATC